MCAYWTARHCVERVCLCVCRCVRSHISKLTCPPIFVHVATEYPWIYTDILLTACTWLMMQRRKMQQSQSADAADASGAAASGGADADASSSSVLKVKAIWKKAVSKLTLRRSKSDDSKSSADSSSTNPGRCATHGSQSRRIGRCVAERTCQLFSDFLRDAVRPHSTTATSTPTPTSSRGNRACRTEM